MRCWVARIFRLNPEVLRPSSLSPLSSYSRKVPRRLENFISQATEAGLMTEEAVQSVLNLVDPFPDDALNAVGWPGMSSKATIPMILTDYLNISPPPNVTNTWSFKVQFLPINQATNFANGIYNTGGGMMSPTLGNTTLSQFNVWTWRDEDPEPSVFNSSPTFQTLLKPAVEGSSVRLTMAGFEAINTSAELYRGGMYYGYRSQLLKDPSIQFLPKDPSPDAVIARQSVIGGLPDKLSDIINLSTTISGSARDGIGVFSLPSDIVNKFIFDHPTRIYITQNPAHENGLGDASCLIDTNSTLTAKVFDWDVCGAYVTGLASQATFQLKARMGFELQPGVEASKSYQSLARTPVLRSFLLEEMLYALLTKTPAGFDYKENPLGEWLARILQGLSAVVPAVAGFIPHPAAKAIGAIAGPALGSIAQAIQTKKKAKQSPQPQPKAKAKAKGR